MDLGQKDKPLLNGLDDEIDGVIGNKWKIAQKFVMFEYPRRKQRVKKDPSVGPDDWSFNIARKGIEKKLRREDPAEFVSRRKYYNLVLVGICEQQRNTWIMSVRGSSRRG